MKPLRLSHSALSRYGDCAHSYKLHYIERIVSIYKSGALFFGSALDLGINKLLEGKSLEEAEDEFLKNWEVGKDNNGSDMVLRGNEYVTYAASDFDKDLLPQETQDSLDFDRFNQLNKKKSEVGWPNLSSEERQYVSTINWLCLEQKGLFMLQGYKDQILPKLKNILAIQKQISLENGTGDSVIGYVDLIAELHDGRIAVIDNKTSAMEYDSDAVTKSPQLSLYKTILNDLAQDPNNSWKHNIDVAGFAVISKQIQKDLVKTCKSCGFVADKGSSHKTCYNEISGKRCGGDWTRNVDFQVKTQWLIDVIPDRVQEMVLENVNAVNASIKAGLFPRNFGNCKGKFGLCPFYSKCWRGSDEGLVTAKERKP